MYHRFTIVQDAFSDPLGAVSPVVVRSAAAQVADQLVDAVREQRLSPGDRLPSERELAQRFGVSRPTIREALAALELAGIVQSHQGKGTLVVATASQVASWGVEVLPPQVFEARVAIEPVLAALAAEKRYPEDIAHLHEVLAELEAEFEATGAYESDLPVHRAIARAARNPILPRALEDALVHTQSPLWVDLRRRALTKLDTREGHVDETRRVIRHIENGEAAEAAAVWREHLLFFRDEMLGR
jgi:DNA-binding FadR family transcriptional regulator